MPYQTIRLDTRDGLAVVTLARPDRMNALDSRMRSEIRNAFAGLGSDVRAVVLTGEGRAFCAGQDLGDAASIGEDDLERLLRDEYEPMLRAIYGSPVPTLAAVNGAAAGAGANLALACDVVIAAESAVFLQAFARIGLIPDAGGTYWLPRQVGFARAMGAALFAEPVPARRAADWGMIWEAVPDADFAETWQRRGRQLANGPTVALSRIRQALRASWGNDLGDQLALEAQLQGVCGRTQDFREGVQAFLDKRPARFEGR